MMTHLKDSHKNLHHDEVGNVVYISIISHTQKPNKYSWAYMRKKNKLTQHVYRIWLKEWLTEGHGMKTLMKFFNIDTRYPLWY